MKSICLFIMCVILLSCKKRDEEYDDSLCSKKMTNSSTALRTNGYYYWSNGDIPSSNIRFIYNDGTMINAGTVSNENIEDAENRFGNGEFYQNIKDNKLFWGIYSINDSNIKFETWYPSTDRLYVYIREGNILNDSTFVITRSYRCDGSEESSKNEVYHFKQFSPKPDSTNSFTN